MFERSAVDNVSHRQTKPTLVEITFQDGRRNTGHLEVSAQRGLAETLNSATAFLEFSPASGGTQLIATNTIAAVRPVSVPRADQLKARSRVLAETSPLQILGLDEGADRETIRAAYHRLLKVYHPDRYAGVELPKEVADYLSATARRINIAHAALANAGRSGASGPVAPSARRNSAA